MLLSSVLKKLLKCQSCHGFVQKTVYSIVISALHSLNKHLVVSWPWTEWQSLLNVSIIFHLVWDYIKTIPKHCLKRFKITKGKCHTRNDPPKNKLIKYNFPRKVVIKLWENVSATLHLYLVNLFILALYQMPQLN